MTTRRQAVLATLGLGCAAQAAVPGLQWHERSLLGLGTTLQLRVGATGAAQATRALDAAVAAIRAVEASMSLFDDRSELSRLNRDGVLPRPSPLLLQVLGTAQQVAARSGGAFDTTVQPLWLAYAAAQRQHRLPTPDERRRALRRVGWRGLSLSPQAVRLARPGMAVTLNGIAQGFAADAARAALQRHGIEHALVDTGEFSAWGRNDRGGTWTLGVEDPRDSTRLLAALACSGRCVATSADHRSAFTADRRHHHILDPARGLSPPALSSVTVAAPSATLADALTKVMFVGGPARIPALARDWGVDVLWVDKQGRWQATEDLLLL